MNFWDKLKLKIFADSWDEYGLLKYTKIQRETQPPYRPPTIPVISGKEVNFKHSGNSGDIIYSLPFTKFFCQVSSANFFLHLNQPANYTRKFSHPLGNVMLNQRMLEMLQPLLNVQDWISKCEVYKDQDIDIDLDEVRNAAIPFDKICLSRWYFLVFGLSADLSTPWLTVEPDSSVKNSIVLARSNRYHGFKIDYSFLKKYSNIQFIGIEDEFNEMKKLLPRIEYRPVKNFLEMASLIAGAKLFIGNQSFPFSLAEALKANRLLEVSMYLPDVCVTGPNGQQFYFQEHFEKLVKVHFED